MEVCGVEQSRARKFLSHQGHTGGVADLLPFDNKNGFSGLDVATRRLQSLLLERGMLCSKSHPCSVKSVSNHSLQVCLPELSGPGGTMCQATPIPYPAEGPFLLKACSKRSRQRCFRFDLNAIMEYFATPWQRSGRMVPMCARYERSIRPAPRKNTMASSLRAQRA